MKNEVIGYYSIFLGISVIGMWSMILLFGNIPEGKTEISFHLISEFLMALICLISGIFLLKKHPLAKSLNVIGLGMIIYSVLNAAGYYGARNQTSMMIMFLVLLLLTLIAILFQLIRKD